METRNDHDQELIKFEINRFLRLVNREAPIKFDDLGNPEADQLGEKVTLKMMRFFAAQIKSNKPYPFALTAMTENDFDHFFSILHQAKGIVNEKVAILTEKYTNTPHWYSAQIKIDHEEIKILLICSLGNGWPQYFADLLKKIKEYYPKHQLTIYIDKTRRQGDFSSCSVIVLEDMKDLHKMHYLAAEFEKDIFKYLEQNTVLKTHAEGFYVRYARLPLRMMRCMQSTDLITNLIPSRSEEEQKLPINKKNEITIMSLLKGFNLPGNQNSVDLIYQESHRRTFSNYRITFKFAKALAATRKYLTENDNEKVIDAIKEFELTGLSQRLSK